MKIHPAIGINEVRKLIRELEKNPAELKDLMQLICSSDQRISMRASWVMLHFSFSQPEAVAPFLPELLRFLNQQNIHSGSIRNCIRMFTVINIPEAYCAEVYDRCMNYLTNPGMPHAVRAFSIQAMLNICSRYPELANELISVIRQMTEEDLAPSLKVWARKAEQWYKKLTTPQRNKKD